MHAESAPDASWGKPGKAVMNRKVVRGKVPFLLLIVALRLRSANFRTGFCPIVASRDRESAGSVVSRHFSRTSEQETAPRRRQMPSTLRVVAASPVLGRLGKMLSGHHGHDNEDDADRRGDAGEGLPARGSRGGGIMPTVIQADALRGKVALVTGAGSGIGRASALTFAAAGAGVVVCDVAVDAGEASVQLIKAAGGEAAFMRADVAEAEQVAALIGQIIERYGRLDYAHNNAGIEPGGGTFIDYPEANWDRVIAVNLTGVWHCMKHEIAQMLVQGGGAIVNTSSIYGLVGGGGVAYVASKHGVIGLTKTAAVQYATAGIRVNAVCPGLIETPLVERVLRGRPEARTDLVARHPIGRVGTPEEVAEAVVWLCSDAASFVTGQALGVDGGYVAQ